MVHQASGGLIERTGRRSVNTLLYTDIKPNRALPPSQKVEPSVFILTNVTPCLRALFWNLQLSNMPSLLIFGFCRSKTTRISTTRMNHGSRLIPSFLFWSYTWKNVMWIVSHTVYMPHIKIYCKWWNRKILTFVRTNRNTIRRQS